MNTSDKKDSLLWVIVLLLAVVTVISIPSLMNAIFRRWPPVISNPPNKLGAAAPSSHPT